MRVATNAYTGAMLDPGFQAPDHAPDVVNSRTDCANQVLEVANQRLHRGLVGGLLGTNQVGRQVGDIRPDQVLELVIGPLQLGNELTGIACQAGELIECVSSILGPSRSSFSSFSNAFTMRSSDCWALARTPEAGVKRLRE